MHRVPRLLVLGCCAFSLAGCVVAFDTSLPDGPVAHDGGDAGPDADASPDAPSDLSDAVPRDVASDPDSVADTDLPDPDAGNSCEIPNACGGCSPLDGQPGDPCGRCGSDHLVCATTEALACDGDTPCANPPPGAPAMLTASDGVFEARVRLAWSPVNGAIAYRVYRGGVFVAESSTTSYDDDGAPAAPAPGAPTATASRNRTDGILLTWTAPATPAASAQTYAVTSVGEQGESVASATDTGYRGPRAITGYDIAVGDGDWIAVDDAESDARSAVLSDEERVPLGLVVPGTITASTDRAAVELAATGFAVAAAAPVSIQVRARAGDVTSVGSDPVEGARAIGTVSYRWERATSADGPWTALPGAGSGAVAADATAPSDGSTVWYRAVGLAAGAAEAASAPVAGARGTVPGPPIDVVASTNRPDRIGVSWAAPDGPVTGYAVQVNGGAWTDVGNVFTWDDTGAAPGTHSGCTSVMATDGTRTDGVLVTCDGAAYTPGASRSYRVRASNGLGDGEPSDTVVGARGGAGLSYTFERSSGPSDGGYTTVSTGSSPSYLDTGVAAGVTRFWRVRVELSPAPPGPSTAIVSSADSGVRGTE